MTKAPVVSIAIPTYNEEENIKGCLDSIFSQNYPKKKIEVNVVDGGSNDNTVKVAKRYPFVKVLRNPDRDTHIGKMLGLKAASGEFWVYFDADLQTNGEDWVRSMVQPLLEDASLTASVSRYHSRPGDSWIENYINLDPIGRDTLFAWFTPSIESTIKKWKDGYAVCEYEVDKIPPEGRCLFRRSLLMKYIGSYERFRELDTLFILTSKGHDKYAYVPKPGYHHKHPHNLSDLRCKRMRNTVRNYIPGSKDGYIKYTWFNLSDPVDFFKMVALVFYALSIIGPILGGIYKTVKHRNIAGMMEVVYVPVAVEAYIEAFVRSKDGRKFIRKNIKKLIGLDV